jgi:hypothetical protein
MYPMMCWLHNSLAVIIRVVVKKCMERSINKSENGATNDIYVVHNILKTNKQKHVTSSVVFFFFFFFLLLYIFF